MAENGDFYLDTFDIFDYFSLDVKTGEGKRVCKAGYEVLNANDFLLLYQKKEIKKLILYLCVCKRVTR